ncbi:hypothetical protein V9T40_006431 [Parthenolecanium corni]|uniref:Copine-3 n=1 Tax=Parthenolecanium corni TaxID=536013 RepID=A0AAN9TPP8_9HEMI
MAFIPGSAASATSEVELSISARDLRGSDTFSKSDPMCVTFIQPFGTTEWQEFHRTETIQDNHNPDFVSKIVLPYKFEEQQPIKFEIYDVDSTSQRLSDHDFLGFAVCNLGQIVSKGKVKIRLRLGNKEISSSIIIEAEELVANNDEVVLQLTGTNLDKKDWFGKSDPFIEIYKFTDSGDCTLVHKTEVIKNTLNPRWKRFFVPIKILCNGDYDRSLKFACLDWNSSGSHSRIGEFQTTLRQLSENNPKFDLIHPDKKKKSNYKNSGVIQVEHYEIYKVFTFMDFIKGGLQIHCTVAIDFTGSNGDPSHPQSLHFINPTAMNSYEQAINSVVSIIQDYDSDKQFPVLGFGARIPPNGQVSHEFFVNMNPANPYCNGVVGVLEAYRNCIRQVQLFGPTNFSPVIEHVIKFAKSYDDGKNYFILLILTDGVITDMPQTIKSIVAASGLPISIIIVGIGNAEFDAMEVLDADRVPLESHGVRAQRDIVQFVPFNKFLSQGDPRTARVRLAKEVLAEVPRQVVSYMRSRGFAPQPAQQNISELPPNPDQL